MVAVAMNYSAKRKFAVLVPGKFSPPYDGGTLEESEAMLCSTVERLLPEVAAGVKRAKAMGTNDIAMHQDGLAAAYNVDEYTLTGMAVKYIGLHGLSLTVTGTNGESIEKEAENHI